MGRRHKITDEEKQKHINDAAYLYDRLTNPNNHPDSVRTNLGNHFELIRAQYANVFLPTHNAIYFYLLKWAIGNTVKTTHAAIQRKSGVCKRTVITFMKDLVTYGLISREKRGVKDSAFSKYRLLEYAEGETIRETNKDKLKKPVFERRAKVQNTT